MVTETYSKAISDLSDYLIDASQRSILLMDILRKRGNIYHDHLQKHQPPVLVFPYEMIMDGRTFERPVNYALVRIIDRRRQSPPEGNEPRRPTAKGTPDRRHQTRIATEAPEATNRPIVIFDPRAGHGPGIGGSKKDSQIGMALDAGHPVYFLIFFTRPAPGQTLADVRNAQIKFLEKVCERHPNAHRPAIIGNCQGGWAAALVGAERPDLVGPMVFNGSPLSYWGGVEGINPMRYTGGLLGGVWINSLLSDLGNGYFDGANLVANFENLNPANTLWAKTYHVYANVDIEEKRFLDFEKWWGGFFLMSDKEIHQIVDGLFVGNKLERGEFELETGRTVDLKKNDNPVVVFASFGDNITLPSRRSTGLSKPTALLMRSNAAARSSCTSAIPKSATSASSCPPGLPARSTRKSSPVSTCSTIFRPASMKCRSRKIPKSPVNMLFNTSKNVWMISWPSMMASKTKKRFWRSARFRKSRIFSTGFSYHPGSEWPTMTGPPKPCANCIR